MGLTKKFKQVIKETEHNKSKNLHTFYISIFMFAFEFVEVMRNYYCIILLFLLSTAYQISMQIPDIESV